MCFDTEPAFCGPVASPLTAVDEVCCAAPTRSSAREPPKRDLRKPGLLTQRFPTVHTGRLLQCPDVYVAKQEILDADNRAVHESKLWRLLLWLFLGNGGCQRRA